MSTATTMDAVADLLESTFGKQKLAEIRKVKKTEVYNGRKAIADQIAAIEAERDEVLADLGPKIEEATERHALADKELKAATNSLHALRRKRSSTSGASQRSADKLRHQLRQTADPKISRFIADTYKMRDEVYAEQVREELRGTDRRGKSSWSIIAEVFSNKPSLDERVKKINEAREAAIELQAAAVKDVDAELKKIRDSIPGGEFKFVKTGEVDAPED